MEILVYVTSHEGKVVGGNALCLYIQDDNEKQQMVADICRALEAKAIQLNNGDYMLVDTY